MAHDNNSTAENSSKVRRRVPMFMEILVGALVIVGLEYLHRVENDPIERLFRRAYEEAPLLFVLACGGSGICLVRNGISRYRNEEYQIGQSRVLRGSLLFLLSVLVLVRY